MSKAFPPGTSTSAVPRHFRPPDIAVLRKTIEEFRAAEPKAWLLMSPTGDIYRSEDHQALVQVLLRAAAKAYKPEF